MDVLDRVVGQRRPTACSRPSAARRSRTGSRTATAARRRGPSVVVSREAVHVDPGRLDVEEEVAEHRLRAGRGPRSARRGGPPNPRSCAGSRLRFSRDAAESQRLMAIPLSHLEERAGRRPRVSGVDDQPTVARRATPRASAARSAPALGHARPSASKRDPWQGQAKPLVGLRDDAPEVGAHQGHGRDAGGRRTRRSTLRSGTSVRVPAGKSSGRPMRNRQPVSGNTDGIGSRSMPRDRAEDRRQPRPRAGEAEEVAPRLPGRWLSAAWHSWHLLRSRNRSMVMAPRRAALGAQRAADAEVSSLRIADASPAACRRAGASSTSRRARDRPRDARPRRSSGSSRDRRRRSRRRGCTSSPSKIVLTPQSRQRAASRRASASSKPALDRRGLRAQPLGDGDVRASGDRAGSSRSRARGRSPGWRGGARRRGARSLAPSSVS